MREQRGGDRRTEKGEALEMPETEVTETAEVKLPEQQPEEIKPQEERKRSAELSEVPKLEAETPSKPEKPKTVDTMSVSEAKDAKKEKTEVCGMSKVSLRFRGTQGMKYKDNGEEEHLPMSEMSSETRVQADERTIRLPAELPSAFNVERRGACVSQITAEAAEEGEDWKQPMVSGVTEKLTKREAQQKENKNSKEEQAAEQECSEQSKRAENRKRVKVTKEVARREEEKEVEQEETQVD